MPYSAPSECTYPGCTALCHTGRCDEHPYRVQAKKKRYDKVKRKMYNSRNWKDMRKIILANEPLCRRCQEVDVLRQATVVDHILPWRKDHSLFLDMTNLQPMCKRCHDQKTRRGE